MIQDGRRPAPTVYDWNRPYFSGAAAGRLMLQHCDVCERVVFYPRIVCPYCFATSLSWVEASGRGEIYSFSVVWHPQNAAFDSSVPIVLAVVALEEGVQMVSVVVDRRPEEVAIGMKVSVGFQSLGDGVSLPVFVSAG